MFKMKENEDKKVKMFCVKESRGLETKLRSLELYFKVDLQSDSNLKQSYWNKI